MLNFNIIDFIFVIFSFFNIIINIMKFRFVLYFQIPNLKVSLGWELLNPVVAISIFKLFYEEADRARRYMKDSNVFMCQDF